ncbi:heterokaryon incompatibility protein-domain-containing protein [Cercophora newfieldiana]|uniref:Heterokaryon incompatibility protein-domain-containing protein n=1 Tax=Cercophora newfieldiana TaxID=92897 RepID=A0AA39XU42_9PEZI|nr:heterokaryon incompatibility protein-domain-containing protein [Cercophora newfieldiana]
MRLLNTSTHKLEEFPDDTPPYAILSHRWGPDEVLPGYAKIEMTCRIAAESGIEYAWIDTCCINKTDSSELSESINSMYRWYQESTVCYAYLADESEWFQRGWTLQELLALSAVVFLNAAWKELGTKLSLWKDVHDCTGIPGVFLAGEDAHSASIAQRMSWAAGRNTTKVEDRAYSLMGHFGIYMPILYGEKENAFFRLQEEILKVISDDHTIFAWTDWEPLLPALGMLGK